jgi:S-adenosylmethionine:tRNA ribosyltransferase-isomerase
MKPSDFDFHLPEELIAQYPLEERDASRLMVLDRKSGAVEHRAFKDILSYLKTDDLLILNNTKVIPARLLGRKPTGGVVEIFLVRKLANKSSDERGVSEVCLPEVCFSQKGLSEPCLPEVWLVMIKTSKAVRVGSEFIFEPKGASSKEGLKARVVAKAEENLWECELLGDNITELINELGHVPLPPYIKREDEASDRERYQTVFAKNEGAIAAPTAGLHFTEKTLTEIRAKHIDVEYLTLHTGLATFMPVRVDDIDKHKVLPESYELSEELYQKIKRAKQEGRRVVAVGSTVTRALETVFENKEEAPRLSGTSALFIYPGFRFNAVDALITNFHLPASSLLMMVAAFAGRENILRAYNEAVAERYRFFSYGDCMFIN